MKESLKMVGHRLERAEHAVKKSIDNFVRDDYD